MIPSTISPAPRNTIATGQVLGTKLHVLNYDQALAQVTQFARSGKVALVAASATHLVAEAVDHADFAAALDSFDLVLPDGMPLVWALRWDGHAIQDRVYGPYLMKRVLENAPAEMSHCFFGGTTECLERLQQRVREMNPRLRIADAISPPFGQWNEATEAALIERINRSGADFVWVALGGVRQETWLAKNRERFTRGVFFGVGDAFTLLAGMRPFAPAWMQRCGLTWMHRLAGEPRRLLPRYLRYNTRFVTAYLMDRLRRMARA